MCFPVAGSEVKFVYKRYGPSERKDKDGVKGKKGVKWLEDLGKF